MQLSNNGDSIRIGIAIIWNLLPDAPMTIWGMWYDNSYTTSLMASHVRSVGGISKYFDQGLWLAYLNADVTVFGQSINRRGVA